MWHLFLFQDQDSFGIPSKELEEEPSDGHFSADGHWRCMSHIIQAINTRSQDCPLHAVLGSSFTNDCPQTPVHPHVPQRLEFLS